MPRPERIFGYVLFHANWQPPSVVPPGTVAICSLISDFFVVGLWCGPFFSNLDRRLLRGLSIWWCRDFSVLSHRSMLASLSNFATALLAHWQEHAGPIWSCSPRFETVLSNALTSSASDQHATAPGRDFCHNADLAKLVFGDDEFLRPARPSAVNRTAEFARPEAPKYRLRREKLSIGFVPDCPHGVVAAALACLKAGHWRVVRSRRAVSEEVRGTSSSEAVAPWAILASML